MSTTTNDNSVIVAEALLTAWPTVLLDDVASRGSGHTPTKKRPEYWGGDIKWVSLKDSFRLDDGIISSTSASITKAGLNNSSAVIHARGSVILLRDAGIGKSAVLGEDMAVSQHFMAWKCSSLLYNWFLYYVLQYRKSEFERISNGSTIKTIGLDYFRQMTVQLPAYAEQVLIGDALRNADALISKLESLIAKKQAIKRGMMQLLLTGETRLPGFAKDWTSRKLSELLSYEQPTKYLVRTTKQLQSGAYPVLTAGKTFLLGYTDEIHGVYRSHPSIIFDDFTTASQFVDFDFKAKSSAMKILSAASGISNIRFVYELMQILDFQLGDHKRYWISEYGQQAVRVPSIEEQEAIACIAEDAESEIVGLRRKLEQAQLIKQGMMQELLTGRTRLPPGERSVRAR